MWLHRPWNRCTWHCRRTHKPLCAKWGRSWQTPNLHTFHGHLKSHTSAFRHNRYSSGNHSPNGTHPHHQSNGNNKPNHPTNSGHHRPAHKTTRTRSGNRKAKEARKGSPNNSGNRDSSEWGPQRPRHPRCHASNSCSGTTLARDLILHLSFFDGIGAASVALQYLGANIVFTLSWETNPQCQALLQHHFQSIQHGDVSILTRPQLNEIIRHAAQGTEWSQPGHHVSTSPGLGTNRQVCRANRGTCYPDRPKSYVALKKTGATYTWSCLSSRTWSHTKQSVISSRTSHQG